MAETSETGRSSAWAGTAPRVITETWFFPLAALYGALVVPIFAAAWTGLMPAPPGLRTVAGHAHELLFGYALAVVCGFLVNRVEWPRLALLLGLWLTARLAFLFVPESLLAAVSNIGFAAVLAATAAPRFMKAAKKWRNRLTGPLVIALCACAAAFHLVLARGGGFVLYLILGEAVVLFAVLMLFFGGRLIAPAAAGAIERRGGSLEARVQPRIEGAILLSMIGAAVTGPVPALGLVHGLLLVVAGALAIVRLLRWRLWECAGRTDLFCLGPGYAWLGAGLILLGASRGFDLGLAPATATHAITVGALGTLTSIIMLRTRLLRLRIDPTARACWLVATTILMAVAALARLFGAGSPGSLLLAAACWSTGLLTTFVVLSLERGPAQPSAKANSRSA
ncbi:NnrS family protein [Wenzhouxiangella sediminis]|uniref:NnrS family protein n=2 Tax=Wenzhouxiangella sediminis TaxID=1792836 RepID=A0A3E1KD24_9GAMM|nr:NnrS family protein [Wenzhouxiangella sediminis]